MRYKIPKAITIYSGDTVGLHGNKAIEVIHRKLIIYTAVNDSDEKIKEIVKAHNENCILGIHDDDYNKESLRMLDKWCDEQGMTDEEALKEFAKWGFTT